MTSPLTSGSSPLGSGSSPLGSNSSSSPAGSSPLTAGSPYASLLDLNLNPTFGAVFIGVLLAAVFYGITTLQTIFYYNNYRNDRIMFKALVGTLWILDALSLIMVSYSLYTYLVTNYLNPLALAYTNWGIGAEPIVTGLIAFIVHEFMIYRIWALNRNWTIYVGVLAIFSLFPLALSFTAALKTVIGGPHMWTILTSISWIGTAGDVSTSVLDIIISGTICYQLYRGRTGFAQTDRILNILTIYTIHTGLLPTLLTLAGLIAYKASPNTLIFDTFQIIVSKAYANTFLATLNSRDALRGNNVVSSNNSMTPQVFPSMRFGSNPGASTTMASVDGDMELLPSKTDASYGNVYVAERKRAPGV